MSRRSWGVQVYFALARQQLAAINKYLEKKPPDEAAALAVLASAMTQMCTGLSELTDMIDGQR